MPRLLNSTHATRTFPKYPFSETSNNTHTEASKSSKPTIQNTRGQTNQEEVQENQKTPPPKCQSTSMTSPTSSTGIHLQACIPGTSMMPIGIPPSGEITQLQSAADQQLNAGGHELMQQNSDVNSEHSRAIQPPSFSETLKGSVSPAPRTQKIIRMKIVPPFRKEHFQYPQLLQEDIGKAMYQILSAFQPKFRNKITISRTNLPQHGQNLQILMVTAPREAEEDVARAKLVGIKVMGKTVFPTADEFWRFSPGEFPKRAMIRITNLLALLETDELEELLELPPETNFNDLLEREMIETEAGKVHTGRGRIPIIISSKEHQQKLFQWSMWRISESGKLVWNEVPLSMSIPRLHKCSMCEAENRPQFIGHDDRWCRIRRRTEEPEKPEEQTEEVENESQRQNTEDNDGQLLKHPEQAQESELQQTGEAENEGQAQSTEDTEDSHASSSSSDDESREAASTVQEGEKNTWHETKKKKRKRSKKSSKSSISGETLKTPIKKKPKPKL